MGEQKDGEVATRRRKSTRERHEHEHDGVSLLQIFEMFLWYVMDVIGLVKSPFP
jgi:hypothetical protein